MFLIDIVIDQCEDITLWSLFEDVVRICSNMDKIRILVVEDEFIIAMDINQTLSDLGYEVAGIASTGDDAVRLAGELRPEIVLMDIILKGQMTGIEAAKIIKERFQVPVIYMTGNADIATVKKARETEPYGYILKPINAQNLFSTIDTTLHRYHLESSLKEKSEELESTNEELSAAMEEMEAVNEELSISLSELEEANRERAESEKRYRSLFDSMTEGVALHELVYDSAGMPVDYRIIDCNGAYEKNTGISVSEAKGRLASELYGDIAPPYFDIYSEVVSSSIPRSFEVYFAPLGRDFRITAITPQPHHFATIFEDITDRKRAERVLLESEERYRRITESISDYIYSVEIENGVSTRTSYGSACVAVTGYDAGELSSDPLLWFEMIFPDDRDMVKAWTERILTLHEALPIEHRIRKKDSSLRWIRNTPVLKFNPDGTLNSYEGIVQDITDQKEKIRVLDCHYAITELIERKNNIDEIMRGTVAILPSAVRYEDHASGRIVLEDKIFATGLFPETCLKMSEEIFVNGSRAGIVELCYRDDVPQFNGQDVFLKSELDIIVLIARRLGRVVERLRAQEALRIIEKRHAGLLAAVSEGVWEIDKNDVISQANSRIAGMLGYAPDEMRGRPLLSFIDERGRDEAAKIIARLKQRSRGQYAFMLAHRDGSLLRATFEVRPITDASGDYSGFLAAGGDLDNKNKSETEDESLIELLGMLSADNDLHSLMKEVIRFVMTLTGCEAVGIRLRDGEDFPYFESRGFPEDFILAENSLCGRDLKGQLMRDDIGNPVLECMCGNILNCRFDPAKSFFTENGSFWSNCTTDLLATTTETDRQARTRNRCNGEGYESVALIPLRAGATTFGLLQVNDMRKGRFTRELIAFLERLAGAIALALAHRQMEAGLIENELKFRTIADFTADWEYWMDDTGRFRYVSPACEQITGYSPGEFYENPQLIFSITHPDDIEKVNRHKEETLTDRKGGTIDFRIRSKDGKERWIGHRCQPVYNKHGIWIGIRGSNRDISDYKRMEGILYASEEKFSKAFRISPDSININRLNDGVYIDINEGFTRITGYSAEDVLGRSSLPGDLGIWVRQEDRQKLIDGLRERGEVVGLEAPFRCKDGTIITGLMSAKVIEINQEQCILSITRDISDRKRYEEKLARLNHLHNVLSHVNQALLRSHSHDDLFDEICRIIVEQGGFDLVWIGSYDSETHEVRPVAWAGGPEEYIRNIRVVADEQNLGMSPAGIAVREGVPSICNDFFSDPRSVPWRDIRVNSGAHFVSIAAFPIFSRGEVYGAITVYYGEKNIFQEQEIALLSEIAHAISFGMDRIDEEARRLQAEEALQISEKRFRTLSEMAPVGVYMTDEKGNCIYANQYWLDVAGLSLDEALGRGWLRGVHPEDRENIIKMWDDMAGAGEKWGHEYRFLAPGGKITWVLGLVTPLHDLYGRVMGYIGANTDITDIKHAQDQIRTMSQAVEQSPAAVIITDINANIEYVNQRFTMLTGYQIDEVRGKNPSMLKSGETPEEVYRKLWETISRGGKWHGEFKNKKKNGELYWESASISPILDESGRIVHYLAVKEDITDRKIADDRVKSSLREKEILLKEIHHRVKNNFQIISSLLVLQFKETENEEVKKELAATCDRIQSMAIVHEQLYHSTDFSRIDFSIYISRLVQNLKSLYIHQKPIEFTIDCQNIFLDINKAVPFGLIVNELISNSVKYAFTDQNIDRKKISISLKQISETEGMLKISDNGKGLPYDFSIEKVKTMGLVLVRGLVQQIEGRLGHRSDNGAEFSVVFPLSVRK